MKKRTGFTLIELLIVMVIISIVAGIAVITINTNHHKQYETLTRQLVNSIQLAEQEAMLRPGVLSLAFTPHSFQFYILQQDQKTQQNKWNPLNQAAFGLHKLPANMQITVKINDAIVPANGEPKLIIPPSNDLVPFIILIGKPDETPYYQITGKSNGEVTSEVFQTQ